MTRRHIPGRTALLGLVLGGALLAPKAGAQNPLDSEAVFGSSLALAATADGGLVAVWNRDAFVEVGRGISSCGPERIVGARLDAAGRPAGPPTELVDSGSPPRVAALSSSGPLRALLLWEGHDRRLRVGPLDGDLRLASSRVIEDCSGGEAPARGAGRGHEVVAAGERFWVVWSSACGGPRLRARRLDPEGRPASEPVVVSGGDAGGEPGAAIAVAGYPDGGFAVVWEEARPEGGRGLVARRYRSDGEPRSEPVAVSESGVSPGHDFAAAVRGDHLIVVWIEIDQTFLRELLPDLAPVGPPRRISGPSLPHEDPRIAAAGDEISVTLLRGIGESTRRSECALVRLSGDETAAGELDPSCEWPEALAYTAGGGLVAGWREPVENPPGPRCARLVTGVPGAPAPPPADDAPP